MIKAQCFGFSNTPPLWHNRQFDIQQFEFPQLSLHAYQPKTIPQNIRLGHQMEYVFKQLLDYSDAYNVVVYNLPIRDKKRTIGEIDFILEDKIRSKLVHVELTYKFYIINPEISHPIHQLIGPNKRDTFFKKMEKIKQVQFPLLHSEAGAKALSNNNIDHSKIEHQCCFKAQLFQPFGNRTVDIEPLNKSCLAGYWLRFDDFNNPEFSKHQFYIPTKSEWTIEPNNHLAWQSHSEIIIDINLSLLKEKSPMVWMRNSNAEFQKFFVVWW